MKYIIRFAQDYRKTVDMEIEAENEEEINKMLDDEEYDDESIWRKAERMFADGKEPVAYQIGVLRVVDKETLEKEKKEEEELPFF